MGMISEEKFIELAHQCQATIEMCKRLTADLVKATENRKQQTKLLHEANNTIFALVAFIKNNNLIVPNGVADLPPLLN